MRQTGWLLLWLPVPAEAAFPGPRSSGVRPPSGLPFLGLLLSYVAVPLEWEGGYREGTE